MKQLLRTGHMGGLWGLLETPEGTGLQAWWELQEIQCSRT
jgi:hypothetical protein